MLGSVVAVARTWLETLLPSAVIWGEVRWRVFDPRACSLWKLDEAPTLVVPGCRVEGILKKFECLGETCLWGFGIELRGRVSDIV